MAYYEIDDELSVRIWDSEEKATDPYIYQPHNPDGSPWLARAEAEGWVKSFLGIIEEPVAIESTEEGTTLLEDAE